MSKVIVIIGAGEGISKGVAERFGREGFAVALISRRRDKLEKLAAGLRESGIDAHAFVGDAGDAESMKDAFEQIWDKFTDIDVIHYNAARLKQVSIENETADSLTRDFKVNAGGIMTALKLVLPDMEKRNEGTVLLTGGGFALHPDPRYGSLAIGKAAVRNMAQSLNVALQPKNIFVGTVTVAGFVSPQAEKHTPANIAEQFWKLYTERNTFEILY